MKIYKQNLSGLFWPQEDITNIGKIYKIRVKKQIQVYMTGQGHQNYCQACLFSDLKLSENNCDIWNLKDQWNMQQNKTFDH